MAKKRQRSSSVISNLTQNQAAQISKDIMKAKAKYATNGRGTIATGQKTNMGSLIQSSIRKKIGG